MGGLNRRSLFGAAPALAVLGVPLLAHARPAVQGDAAQHHMDALLDLMQDKYPSSTTRLLVRVSRDLETGQTYLGADGYQKVWNPDARCEHGGYWTEKSEGEWIQGRGLMHWGSN